MRTLLFCLSLAASACAGPFDGPSRLTVDGDNVALTDPAWSTCTDTTDCVRVSALCSTCCVDHAINKVHLDAYNSQWLALCSDYEGGSCDCEGPTDVLSCDDGVCVLVPE
ncbi:MAG: hypothetical protein AB8H79_00270 [Myxococcota bacterium]